LRRIIALMAALAVVFAAGGIAAGSLRYGSPDGLYRRLRAEYAARQPHPLLAPTPLPVQAAGLPVAEPARAASATPGVRLESTATPPRPTSTRTRPATRIAPPASATARVTSTAAPTASPERP
jgi:hypothetical protein